MRLSEARRVGDIELGYHGLLRIITMFIAVTENSSDVTGEENDYVIK